MDAGATLAVLSGQTLTLDGTGTNSGTIALAGTLDGSGTLVNSPGSIDVQGSSWSLPGDGSGVGGLTLNGYRYRLHFAVTAGSAPADMWVYADDLADSGESLPSGPALAGEIFEGWRSGSTTIGSSTQLAALASIVSGVATLTLTPAYEPAPTPTPTASPSPAEHRPIVRVGGPRSGHTYTGGYPLPVCRATVLGSRIRTCAIRERVLGARRGGVVELRFTATAVSAQGLRASAAITIRDQALRTAGTAREGGARVVRTPDGYALLVASRVRPVYLGATRAPRLPAGSHLRFRTAGGRRGVRVWRLSLRRTAPGRYLNAGLRIGRHAQLLTFRT